MMRAKLPDTTGTIDRDGVKLHYEVYGDGPHTMIFVPTWSVVDSRNFKGQIPYFSEHFRCITWDPRGNGKSDRPEDPKAYGRRNYVDDILAIMEETATDKAIIFGNSMSGAVTTVFAAHYPDRVLAAITIGTALGLPSPDDEDINADPPKQHDKKYKDWQEDDRDYWDNDYTNYSEFFMRNIFNEPHSTKQIEDSCAYAAQTNSKAIVATMDVAPDDGRLPVDEEDIQKIKCPLLLIHGDRDLICPLSNSISIAKATGAELVILPGAGHSPHGRFPAQINTIVRDFLARELGTFKPEKKTSNIKRPMMRPKRALYISSPIGLGHARRDLAITRELRKLHPDLQMDWLSQDPVTRFLKANDETIHGASTKLANESSHIESESGEHDLNAFQALRSMDEILVKNFMVFQEAVEQDDYDLIIADEAWDVDFYWHEHPELKKAQVAWLTDFVGFVPMPEGGSHEAFLTADYNAEMIDHVEGHPSVRDRAIFVGNPADIAPHSFGKDLPQMADWIPQHFDFSGYVLGEHPSNFQDREELRAKLGYREDEKVCIVTVGGAGVGGALIRRILEAYPAAKRQIPELRMIIVMGPRLDPDQFDLPPGVEARAFVPDLDRHLAACDLALVQGGLSTTMELTAAGTPFLYFPLKNHFEQNVFVAHRLDQYGAGRKMIFEQSSPDHIAQAMVEEIAKTSEFKPVESDGAARAAQMLSELL